MNFNKFLPFSILLFTLVILVQPSTFDLAHAQIEEIPEIPPRPPEIPEVPPLPPENPPKTPPSELDSDGDGINDDQDECPDQAETYNGYLDEDGCPDQIGNAPPNPPTIFGEEIDEINANWKIGIFTQYVKQNSGDYRDFEYFKIKSKMSGANGEVKFIANEVGLFSSRGSDQIFDDTALSSMAFNSDTIITIECSILDADAEFVAISGKGKGNLKALLADGVPYSIGHGLGTGSSSVAGAFSANDNQKFNYVDSDSVISSDVPTSVSYTAVIGGDSGGPSGGFEFGVNPTASSGVSEVPLSDSDLAPDFNANAWTGEFKTRLKYIAKASDEGIGVVKASGSGSVSHDFEITGKNCGNDDNSELKLSFYGNYATVTTGDGGYRLSPKYDAEFDYCRGHPYFDECDEFSDEHWNEKFKWKIDSFSPKETIYEFENTNTIRPILFEYSQLQIAPSTLQKINKIGINPGQWSRYNITSDDKALQNIDSIRFEILETDKNTGDITVNFQVTDLQNNTFSHNGTTSIVAKEGTEIQWLVIPSMIDVGDSIYNKGMATNLFSAPIGLENQLRDIIVVRYEDNNNNGTVISKYDRETGLLLAYNEQNSFGNLHLLINNSNLNINTENIEQKINDAYMNLLNNPESKNQKSVDKSILTNDKTKEKVGCLIATAAFGSEIAPQIQFLREVRDNNVLSTESGTAFMTTFNQIYYSFSPTIADWERANPAFRETVKTFITPMIYSLSLMTLAEEGNEIQVLGLGLSVILLNTGMYIAAPVIIGFAIHKKIKSRK